MNEFLEEEPFIPWAEWVLSLLAAAEKDGFESSPEEVDALLDRAVFVKGNSLVN